MSESVVVIVDFDNFFPGQLHNSSFAFAQLLGVKGVKGVKDK